MYILVGELNNNHTFIKILKQVELIQRKYTHGDYGRRGVLSVSLVPATEDLQIGQEGVVCNHSSRQLQ